ncbi:lipopolysaccharide biosynthesis protein [Parabacteroides johnsonii]|uniref:lipopolysaccharide biosynthesis protein n=1 Tax=Parabacteroides johnsonii TaxID=387661 RepID=UPI0022E35B00|nr:lipopolysaccharide biosynthesis protein [Parabacteroides johnsonii]
MSGNTENNKRIAKNTLLLYTRMLLMMLVSLFTSRVILQVLGIEDYGVYNVVGGIVSMFAFINGGMVAATQRYITFELGSGNKERLQRVFSTSLQIHAMISILIVILGETVGLWFLQEKLVIPEDRMIAAMWVYQCSILVCVLNIMSIPYNADIVAHEKMSAFAMISVVEVVLKLLVVYLLMLFPFDKLIVYAILLLAVQFSIRLVYTAYCKRHFEESSYIHRWNSDLIKEMLGFAGWSFWGSLAVVLYTQGVNMMLNVFFGPVVNAARGIAIQVQSAVLQFVMNFQMALNPQITKSYAAGNLDQMHSLMFRSARFSFLLLFFIALPVLLETNFLLTLWLKTVPDHTVIFAQIMLCISLVYTTANPCIIANQATGKVKVYQAVVGGILLAILPISYIVLKMGAPAYSVFIVHFCVESVAQFSRMFMLRKLIDLPIWAYMKNIYVPIVATVIVSIILPIFVYMQLKEGWLRFIVVGFACVLSVGVTSLFVCITKHERMFLLNKGFRLLRIKK